MEKSHDYQMLMKLIDSAKERGIEKIIVTSTNRIVGTTQELEEIRNCIANAGIELVSLDGMHTDFASADLISAFLAAVESTEDEDYHGGATCEICGQKMLQADGCTWEYAVSKGRVRKRIKFGEEDLFWGEGRCGDCGAKEGHYHHCGCDIERCPFCGGQLISCSCDCLYGNGKGE